MKIEILVKDLLKMDATYTIAHCISADAVMGAGIALTISEKYKYMRSFLKEYSPELGTAVYYYDGGNESPVFNLVTKSKYNHKPSRDTLESSIIDMKNKMEILGIKKLAIPTLGSGLDGLNWTQTQEFIYETFKDTDIELVICHY